MKNSTAAEDLGVLLIRLMVGVAFTFHGSQKLFGDMAGFAETVESLGIPMPVLGAWLAALSEFVGGLALILGVLMPLFALPLAVTMFVAAFHVHWSDGWVEMEFPLVLGFCAIGLGLIGPGRFAWRPRVAKS